MVDAIVLAGGEAEPGLDPGLPNKAFLEVAGHPLVGHVVAALQHAKGIGRIAVVGPPALQTAVPGDLLLIREGGGIMDNVVQAARALGSPGSILVAAADVPLLTGAVVEEFLTTCARQPADFHYAVVPKAAMDQQFPTAQKTYVTLTDGTFCGGNLMLFNPRVLDRVRPFIERMIAARKKPWLMAQLFGWTTIMKLISHQLSIAELVARATEVVGITVQPVIIPRPEVALDVDVGKTENLELIRRALDQRHPS